MRQAPQRCEVVELSSRDPIGCARPTRSANASPQVGTIMFMETFSRVELPIPGSPTCSARRSSPTCGARRSGSPSRRRGTARSRGSSRRSIGRFPSLVGPRTSRACRPPLRTRTSTCRSRRAAGAAPRAARVIANQAARALMGRTIHTVTMRPGMLTCSAASCVWPVLNILGLA